MTVSPAKVLITSVSAGSGHVRAAEAIHAAAQQCFPTVRSRHIDVMNFVTKPFRLLYADGYSFAVDRLPFVWKKIYTLTDKQRTFKKMSPALNFIQRQHAQEFFDYVNRFRPDVILTTHFLIPQLLSSELAMGRLRCALECVITDFDLHRMWINSHIQKYYVAHEGIADKLVENGVPSSRVVVTGIPIHPLFNEEVSKAKILKDMGLEAGVPVVLLLSGGRGLRALERTVVELFQIQRPMQIITVSGKNLILKTRLEEIKPPSHIRLRHLGFVSNMQELLTVADVAVTKAGGLTVSECLAKGVPMILYSAIPGQEEKNAAYVKSVRAGVCAKNPNQLRSTVERLLKNRRELALFRKNALMNGTATAAYRVITSAMRETSLV